MVTAEPHKTGRLVYHRRFAYPDRITMLEINPVLHTIKDLKGRSETLRGYL